MLRDYLARKAWVRLGSVALIYSLVLLIALKSVQQELTNEDRQSLIGNGIINSLEINRAASLDYESQAEIIKSIQARVHAKVRGFEPIPLRRPREPEQVLAEMTGVCFDRARVIEKAMRLAGFSVRRVYLLYVEGGKGFLSTLLSSGVPSHTLIEVKTVHGWAFVGTLTNANGLTAQHPLAARDVRGQIRRMGRSGWKEILDRDFTPIVGLYSRHGQHYAPYLPFPDISIKQMLSGLLDP